MKELEIKKFISLVKKPFAYFIDFLLPNSCINCGKEIDHELICHNCLELLSYPRSPLCPHCGRPIDKTKTCIFCKDEKNLDYGRAFLLYLPPVDKMIHHLKYRGKPKLAKFFGLGMATVLKSDFYLKEADFLVSVPLFWWKKARRTYNQAE
ncbi:MAG: double zinc ribbon domain-containing protein, partial [candidate division WOR-3 bacterium]